VAAGVDGEHLGADQPGGCLATGQPLIQESTAQRFQY
jgi:hypothetical protein